MNEFPRPNPSELDRLDSDELVAYIREAHGRGDRAGREAGFSVLVFRHERDVKRRVAIKVPPPDVEDVAQEALFSAVRNVLEGSEMRSFQAVLNTIVSRRIADYTDKRARTLKGDPLAEEHGDDDEIWGEVPSAPDESGAVGVQQVIDQVYAELNEVHRAVIDLYVFEDRKAQDAADLVNERFNGHPDLSTPMSVDNVHKIAARFRDHLRDALEGSGG